MKKLILIALLMCSATVNAQLVSEAYNSDNDLIGKTVTKESRTWVIDANETDTREDDVLHMYHYDRRGNIIEHTIVPILEMRIKNATYTLKVEGTGGEWYNIIFWFTAPDITPLVGYEYSDGHILYHGNIKY